MLRFLPSLISNRVLNYPQRDVLRLQMHVEGWPQGKEGLDRQGYVLIPALQLLQTTTMIASWLC